ncbi:ABC transporter substrate-binding protein [Sneathia sanguinegens]|uniref:ABC transporter substrate-binding protein n=1 Tax=Sneathia sanguinegens TaxID=40543 RepID=A0ABT7HIM5_9FUSO|nr:ABC transporter substrate-binding protein [Sneathia sanguinegens]MDK9580364.1 ABC transporter substrate-binding protein [Sneathia sanguinegens]
MNKKIFILFSLLLVFFVSCQSNTEKTLTYNLVSEPTTIDPHNFNELVSVQLMNNIYEGLLRIDEKGNYVPALAKSYTENGTKLTFTLKDNLKWSDGSKLTIDDIIFGFKRALDKNTASRFAEYLFPIKNAKKFNAGLISEKELGIQNVDGKLVITLEKPTPYFKDILTLPISFPVKKGITQDIGDYTKALYNGPYIIQKMDNSSIILKENKYYWNKKETKFKNVKLLFISDFGVLENFNKKF